MGTTTVSRFAASIPLRVGLAKKAIAFAIHEGVGVRTPRDTGRAAASWNIAAGTADLSVAAEVKRGAGKEGVLIQSPPPPDLGFIPEGVPIIISNNLPYIKPLNDGHSSQAPKGFVQSTVDDVLGQVDGIAHQIKADAETQP